jgi:serine/threonine protein phosphatase PrpC
MLLDPDLGLYAVADGMGGHNAGEVASGLAVDTLLSFVQSSGTDSGITWPFGFNTAMSFGANQLKSAILLANRRIRDQSAQNLSLAGMGSTIVVTLVSKSDLIYANVGDSRLYLWRERTLTQLTEDDSWAASMLRAGADAEAVRHHQLRHVLTRALGSDDELNIGIGQTPLQDNDLLLLCSDGLYGPVGDDGIQGLLRNDEAPLDTLAQNLVDAANQAGGPDNVTALVMRWRA